ncbi:helix-turn-helix transcriptional regulator [Tomitella fengzijianii]|uniref:WYL domain-containing protein n=1 Tax=Tomitella fengzijianii TaxID=2597660 RepID=A0A516X2R7_9ACTN|nr:WYL domain-containing protein [Tomitella fengzijianii]QDQ97376.1 WYL domain-containing protein [Tomitella fengzijianii]
MSGIHTNRVSRLLALVPLISANQGRLKSEIAKDMGITVKQLEKDLGILWMCGRPGLGGGDLIDVAFTGDTVEVTDSQGIDRPLRLTTTEASALLLALGFLVEQQSSIMPAAARNAMFKIEQAARETAAGSAPAQDGAVTERPSEPAADTSDPAAADAVRDAVNRGRALRMQYYSATRDARTERVVDPVRIQLVAGNSYLQAWCRLAEGERMFRLDRIDSAEVLEEASDPHSAEQVDALADFYDSAAGLPQVHLAVAPDCLWALDYFPMNDLADHTDGGKEVSLRYASEDWLRRFLLSFGGRIRILDRPAMSQLVHARAVDALDAYARTEAFPVGAIGDGQG